jgi:hypothetical protein
VRVMAASINPSDVKNVADGMKQTRLPRRCTVHCITVWGNILDADRDDIAAACYR